MSTAARPKVGVLLPTREHAIVGDVPARSLIEFAIESEALGFDSVWAGDSLIARPRLDPLVLLGAVAAVTTRVGLGTAAFTPALRHPLISANMINAVDRLSAGRLMLGLGSGFPIPETEREFASVGASFRGRSGHLDRIVEVWRHAWRAERVGAPDAAGAAPGVEETDLLLPPLRAGGPPLWLASSDTPAVLRRVSSRYDGWLPFLPSVTAYRQAWQRITELVEEAGRPADAVTPGLYATINVNSNEASARAEMDDYVRRYYNNSLENMAAIQAYGWGSARECAEWLSSYVAAGARHIIIRIGSLTPRHQLREIAETVLPAVREQAVVSVGG